MYSYFHGHYSAGTVVILLQKSQDYKVLAVGKVVEVDAHVPVPEMHVPVFVAYIEECALAILVPVNVVFWHTDLLAVCKFPTMETTERSQNEAPNRNLNSNISEIPPGSEEDRFLNYGLQVIQLGIMLMQLNDTEAEGMESAAYLTGRCSCFILEVDHGGTNTLMSEQ